jgi:cellulose synthase/poly-beta-1,6-N-acetylglucosamine synthase-like glycosyltransferase
VPTSDFLRRPVPYFADPQIGMVQARWTYLNRAYSLLTKVQAMILDTYFGMEHFCRSRSGVFFNFTGTAGIWRRTAIRDAGGWQSDTLTEDIDLSYRAQMHGWRLIYLLDVECPSELPVEMNGFKEQQARWAKGATQVGLKILPGLLRSKQSPRIKAEAFLHLTGSISCPFAIFLAGLVLPTMIVRMHHPEFRTALIDVPCVVSSLAAVAFLLTSQRVIYPRAWKRSIVYLPLLFAVFFGMSLRISKAVFEALWGIQSDFVRTAKFNIDGRSRSWHAKKYRSRGGWLPYLEIAFAGYFAFALDYSIRNHVYRIAPFLLFCASGLMYMGVLSLTQSWKGLRGSTLLDGDLPMRLPLQNSSDGPRRANQEIVPGD